MKELRWSDGEGYVLQGGPLPQPVGVRQPMEVLNYVSQLWRCGFDPPRLQVDILGFIPTAAAAKDGPASRSGEWPRRTLSWPD